MNPTAEQLKTAITQGGFKPRTYSGRGVFGVHCVGVNLDSSVLKTTQGVTVIVRVSE